MALITCNECSKQLSDLAKLCPHCGAPSNVFNKEKCFECDTPLDSGIATCPTCGVDQSLNPLKKDDDIDDFLVSAMKEPIEEDKQKAEDSKMGQQTVTNVSVNSGGDATGNAKCPKCGSTSIHAAKNGFSGGKACCGALLVGPLGLLCGTNKRNKVNVTCLNCKHKW